MIKHRIDEIKTEDRPELRDAEVWVVKVGSALITREGAGLNQERIGNWCRQIAKMLAGGKKVVLVSSGAIALGYLKLGFKQRPEKLSDLQAAAAVGQIGVIQAYEEKFRELGRQVGSVLLTHDDMKDRSRYLNARNTLGTLLKHGIVPIINENDSVATEEIKFGDNDTLAARVSSLVSADALLLLTDQPGLLTKDPRIDSNAELVERASAFDAKLNSMAGKGHGSMGRGGMITKISAARHAAKSGCHTVIADGGHEDVIVEITNGQNVGTWLTADVDKLDARKQWIAGQLNANGEIQLDLGATKALTQQGVSILPIGVTGVSGNFQRGDIVAIRDPKGLEIARGLINYGANESRRLAGRGSDEIESVIGYVDQQELIHRDNLVLLGSIERFEV